MRLQDNGSIENTSDLQRQLRQVIVNVHRTSGKSADDFAEMIGVSVGEFESVRLGRTDVSLRHLHSLSQSIDLNFNLLMSGQIDYPALAKRLRGNSLELPSRYSDKLHQTARVRAVKSMVDFMGRSRSEEFSARLLGRLQLYPDQLAHADDFVSPLVGMDLLHEAGRAGFGPHAIRTMGTKTVAVARDTAFGRALARARGPELLYRAVFEEHRDCFDRVWSYRLLKISRSGCIMEVRPSVETLDIFRVRSFGNRQICLFLQGVFMSLLGSIEARFANLDESECMYGGGRRCVYRLRWS